MIQVEFNNEQKVTATIHPQTSKGTPVEIDGPAKWSVPSGDVTLIPSEDGKSCEIISSDTPGVSQVLVEADADLGEGVVTVSDVIEVTIQGALASNLGTSISAPEDK